MPKMSPSLEKALRKARKRFIRKLGREPGSGDPVFFDEEADTPQAMDEVKVESAMLEAMLKAGTPPSLIYPFARQGGLSGKRVIEA